MTHSRSLPAMLKDRAGASAVEFAIVLPVFLAMLFGIITYGGYLAAVHGVQQIAAEAARAALAGLSEAERVSLAKGNISSNASSYPLLSPSRITLESAATDEATRTITVTVRYDAADMFIFQLPAVVPMPSPVILRSAAIQRGGY